MIGLPTNMRVFVATAATDMRKGFNGLSGVISQTLQEDPLSGHLFLFINRRRDRLKIFYWDGDGLAIWYKRLERGRYQLPAAADDVAKVEIRRDELGMLLGGIDLHNIKRRKRFAMAEK